MVELYRLKNNSPFIIPEIYNSSECKGVALSSHTVKVSGTSLSLENPTDVYFEVGETVYVKYQNGGYYCYTEADKRRMEEEKRRQQEEWEHRQKEKERKEEELRQKELEEARSFNQRIQLPVGWTITHKIVLSGLSVRSSGAGTRSNTVDHVLLIEDLEGRLKRKAGEFLCTHNTGSWGHPYMDRLPTKEEAYKTKFENHLPVTVTCKQCLKILKRKEWLRDS